MKFYGQIILITISILFTVYQKWFEHKPFLTFDFLFFTLLAWFVGYQYDRARYYELKARSSEESYKRLIDSLPEPVYVTHHNYRLLYANDAALEMVGAEQRDEILGRSILEFISPEYSARLKERFKQLDKSDKPVNIIEYKAKRMDGTSFFFEVASLDILFEGKPAILSIGKDISVRKEETERMLLKSEKLALLGQMAAGLAHEIRNPLTSIKGFIQLFRANHQKDDYYEIVLSELDRINGIVGEFLYLAKPTAAVFIEKDISALLMDVMTLIKSQSVLNNVQIFMEAEKELPKVSCEEKQVKQVFLNLLKNAMEAMPKGGTIWVKIKEKQKGQISIQIIDHGVGIPQERIATLGEPFYTTKEKGTGLGLMTCFKIIENHNGEITINSRVNEGTTIEVLLPTISQPQLLKELSY